MGAECDLKTNGSTVSKSLFRLFRGTFMFVVDNTGVLEQVGVESGEGFFLGVGVNDSMIK